MSTPRPRSVDAGPHTQDDGYFGPDSVTWRVSAHPASGLVGLASATIQMLYPPVMHMIDQASTFRKFPELRARRTAEFAATVVFGDKASADHAGETLRRIHRNCVATNPVTGETYHADEPELLLWVQNVLTWIGVRATDEYGPSLTAEERERYVVEQKIMGNMVGLPDDAMPDTFAAVDDYMTSMVPKLALSYDALWFRDIVIPRGISFNPGDAIKDLMTWGAISLFAPEHRELYGIRWSRWREITTKASVHAIIKPLADTPLDEYLPQARQYVDEHAFGARKKVMYDDDGHTTATATA